MLRTLMPGADEDDKGAPRGWRRRWPSAPPPSRIANCAPCAASLAERQRTRRTRRCILIERQLDFNYDHLILRY